MIGFVYYIGMIGKSGLKPGGSLALFWSFSRVESLRRPMTSNEEPSTAPACCWTCG